MRRDDGEVEHNKQLFLVVIAFIKFNMFYFYPKLNCEFSRCHLP
jgi:hypothetical protein